MMEFQRMTAVAIEVESCDAKVLVNSHNSSSSNGNGSNRTKSTRRRESQIIISIFIICLYKSLCSFVSCHSSSLNLTFSSILSFCVSLLLSHSHLRELEYNFYKWVTENCHLNVQKWNIKMENRKHRMNHKKKQHVIILVCSIHSCYFSEESFCIFFIHASILQNEIFCPTIMLNHSNTNRKFERKDLSKKVIPVVLFVFHISRIWHPQFSISHSKWVLKHSKSAHKHIQTQSQAAKDYKKQKRSAHTNQTNIPYLRIFSAIRAKWHGSLSLSLSLQQFAVALKMLLVRWCSMFHVEYIPFW